MMEATTPPPPRPSIEEGRLRRLRSRPRRIASRRRRPPDPPIGKIFVCLSSVMASFVGTTFYLVTILDRHLPSSSSPSTASLPGGHHHLLLRGGVRWKEEGKKEEHGLSRPWDREFVHVLNTRFMQDQGHLQHLAMARLELFEAFCLPTVLGQTALLPDDGSGDADAPEKKKRMDPKFLWIVKVDPDLDAAVLSKLEKHLRPHDNFYLVGSNVNYGVGIHPGGWRGGQAGRDVLDAAENRRVYTGNVDLLKRAHEARQERVVLETRLDADDGLNVEYLRVVQEEAVRKLGGASSGGGGGGGEEKENKRGETAAGGGARGPKSEGNSTAVKREGPGRKARWMYWCAMSHIEWSSTPTSSNPSPPPPSGSDAARFALSANSTRRLASPTSEHGVFLLNRSPHVCVTPGLTLGSAVGTSEESLPRYMHQKLVYHLRYAAAQLKAQNKTGEIHECGIDPPTKCLHLITNPQVGAIRSRTPTSAGMRMVVGDPNVPNKVKAIEKINSDERLARGLWDTLEWNFDITKDGAERANRYVEEHLLDVVRDNMRGQCTKGHSCKVSSMDALQRLLDLASEG